MRTLLIGPGFALPGGIQYVGHLMARGLNDLYGDELKLEIASLLDGPDPTLTAPVAEWSGSGGSRRQFVGNLRRHLRRRPELILLNHIHLLPYLGAAAIGLRTGRVAVVVHGIEAWRRLSAARRFGLGRVDRMIYVSDFSRRRAIEATPQLAGIEARICHHGLLPQGEEESSPAASNRDEAGDRDYVLMIGRMSSQEQYKGYEEVIRAWPKVRERRPGLGLVLVGDGDDRSRLELIGAKIEGVRFVGQVSDPERDRLMQGCRAFALPSRGEGFGLVYLEAMKAGRPVLAGALDAGAEVIVDGVTGRAVDPGNESELVNALEELTSARGVEMGKAGARRYRETFTFESYRDRLRSAIESLRREGRDATRLSLSRNEDI